MFSANMKGTKLPFKKNLNQLTDSCIIFHHQKYCILWGAHGIGRKYTKEKVVF